jgi:hypothetical protein
MKHLDGFSVHFWLDLVDFRGNFKLNFGRILGMMGASVGLGGARRGSLRTRGMDLFPAGLFWTGLGGIWWGFSVHFWATTCSTVANGLILDWFGPFIWFGGIFGALILIWGAFFAGILRNWPTEVD